MRVEINLPTLLADCVGGSPTVFLEATTLAEALDRMLERYPLLRIHLFDEAGRTRPHVRLFYNGENLAYLESLDIPLTKGARLDVLQAVSGG
jgi:molybdopterin converting factor small subunit